MDMKDHSQPAIWFPTIRAGSGTDVFTERLVEGLRRRGIKAEITWMPLRTEYAPWSVNPPTPPSWINVAHINSWLHPRFVPMGLPTVVTVHHSVHDPAFLPYKTLAQKLYHRLWIRHIESVNLKRAHIVVAVSHHVATQLTNLFNCSNVIVIPNGIDVEHTYTPSPIRSPHQPFRLLYVGNWRRGKGVDLLAPILEKLGPGFQLYYTADRTGAHQDSPLPPETVCIGRLHPSDLVPFYQDADALIFPSRCEGLPLVAVEAMACGLPVIASNVSALKEVVEHGVTGFLCRVDQVDDFVEAVKTLRADETLWQQMRHAARERAVKYFSCEQQVDLYLNCYRTILS